MANPLCLALRACIIQSEYGYSDEETALQIQEDPYLQFFCGFPKYEYKQPFDPSLMVYFRKRLTSEILGEINELIIQNAKKEPEEEHHNDKDNSGKPQPPQNAGTMIVDATCAPLNIKYPQDTELLNEVRENTEAMIDGMHDPKNGKRPRTYRKLAHKSYLKFTRGKKKTGKQIRRSVRQQLGYLKRNLGVIDGMLSAGKNLRDREQERLKTIRTLYEQQKFMYDNKVHSVPDRIVSLSQPYLRPIIRGKAKVQVEFGAKLDISVVGGFVRLEKQSFDSYNESTCLQEEIERYKDRKGCYPKCVLADKIYRNRANLSYCKKRGIRLSGPALGRPKAGIYRYLRSGGSGAEV